MDSTAFDALRPLDRIGLLLDAVLALTGEPAAGIAGDEILMQEGSAVPAPSMEEVRARAVELHAERLQAPAVPPPSPPAERLAASGLTPVELVALVQEAQEKTALGLYPMLGADGQQVFANGVWQWVPEEKKDWRFTPDGRRIEQPASSVEISA